MTLDEKLKDWREATESLEPSSDLMAALEATVEGQSPPASGGSGLTGVIQTGVKVLMVSALIGAIGSALLSPRFGLWRWAGSANTPPVDSGTPLPLGPLTQAGVASNAPLLASVAPGIGEMATPIREMATSSGALLEAIPNTAQPATAVPFSAFNNGGKALRARADAFRHQLEVRPLQCLAQRFPIEQLLELRLSSEREQIRLVTRLLFLCGAKNIPGPVLAQLDDLAGCDNSDWRHQPFCHVTDEGCARLWAERPASSCTGRAGRRTILAFVCARFLVGEATEADVRAQSTTAWCLTTDALAERDRLRSASR